jgi:competence protein ComEC
LVSIPANVLVAPLAALAMPLALAAAVAGLAWQPLGEIVAAPAGIVAAVILGIVDRLGTEQAEVRLGLPPVQVSAVIALTCVALVMLLTTGSHHGEARRILDLLASRKRSPGAER